jgi:hypothetical protein
MIMAPPEQQRLSMIEQEIRRRTDAPLGANVLLWERLALELVPIIGERGFASLYSRSLHQAYAQFPWLAPLVQPAGNQTFPMLAKRLAGHDPVQATSACAGLLIIFTDTLILLIGELLTNSILSKAWGDDVVNNAGTEHRL